MRRAIGALTDPGTSDEDLLGHYLLGITLCTTTWDDRSRTLILRRAAEVARAAGALADLDTILYCDSMAETNLGDLRAADAALVEGHEIRSALGATPDQWEIYRHPELLAWHGDGEHLAEIFRRTAEAATMLGHGGRRGDRAHRRDDHRRRARRLRRRAGSPAGSSTATC